MTINLIEFPYHPYTTLNLFEQISSIPWSMLLYSGHDNNHPDGQFDILVTNPSLTLITNNNITAINAYNKNYKISNKNPFILLQEYMKIYKLQSNDNYSIPFQGGFLGVFGYDLARYIESLPNLSKKDVYLPDMALGFYRWAIISDHKLLKNYLITHDHPNSVLKWIYQKNTYNNLKKSFRLLNVWKSNMSYFEYSKKFKKIKKHLTLGNCYQVCLSQRFSAPYDGNEWIAFRHLLHYNPVPFSAFIKLPNNSSILSFSPERFIKLKNSNIKTQPIKGTLSRLHNIKDDQKQKVKLYHSSKNKSENLMIVDLLRNDFGKIAIPGSIKVTQLFKIQSFANVHHMISTITGKLDKNFSICDLLQACFPGGSITGAPKIQAMKLIEELEPHRRSIWSGSIGYLSCCGNIDTNIAIRTLFTNQKYLFCYVGSGIIFDSNQDAEYQEMQDKISTLLIPLLNISQLKL